MYLPSTLRQLVNAHRGLRRQRRFHWRTRRVFLKFYLGRRQIRRLEREESARAAASAGLPWRALPAHFNERLLFLPWMGIVMSRTVSGSRPSLDQCKLVARDVLGRIGPDPRLEGWNELIDRRVLDELVPSLPVDARDYLLRRMDGVRLPWTGAHGDFWHGNILWDEGGAYSIVDWENFRQEGSCLEDVCLLLAKAASHKEPPGVEIRPIVTSRVMTVISESGYLSEEQAMVLSVIARASCHVGRHPAGKVLSKMTARLDEIRRFYPI